MSELTRRIMQSLTDRVAAATGRKFSYVALGDGTTITGDPSTVLRVLGAHVDRVFAAGGTVEIRDASLDVHPGLRRLRAMQWIEYGGGD